jgi:hypothetical protein
VLQADRSPGCDRSGSGRTAGFNVFECPLESAQVADNHIVGNQLCRLCILSRPLALTLVETRRWAIAAELESAVPEYLCVRNGTDIHTSLVQEVPQRFIQDVPA